MALKSKNVGVEALAGILVVVLNLLKVWVGCTGHWQVMVLKSFDVGVDRDWQVMVLKSFDVGVDRDWQVMVLKSFDVGVDRDWQVMVLKSFDVWVVTGKGWSRNPLMSG